METVSAGISDSCEHVEEKGTVCVMSADTAAAESLHCNATSTGEVWTRDTLQLEIFTLDAIHAGTVAVVLGDTLNLVLSSVEVLAADQLIEETLAEDILAAETLSVELVTADTLADGRQTVAVAAIWRPVRRQTWWNQRGVFERLPCTRHWRNFKKKKWL